MQRNCRFTIEEIPDDAMVFRRIKKKELKTENGKLKVRPSVFALQPKHKGRFSVNWIKYASVKDTIKQSPVREYNGCISLLVRKVREVNVSNDQLIVEHNPDNVNNNKAHSVIHRSNKFYKSDLDEFERFTIEQRIKLQEISEIEKIPIELR